MSARGYALFKCVPQTFFFLFSNDDFTKKTIRLEIYQFSDFWSRVGMLIHIRNWFGWDSELIDVWCKFCWGTSRYASAAVEKPSKTDDNPSQKRQKSSVCENFLPVFWPLLPCTSMCPNEICIICSHTLARLPRKISAGSAHRGPSNRPRSPSTRATWEPGPKPAKISFWRTHP